MSVNNRGFFSPKSGGESFCRLWPQSCPNPIAGKDNTGILSNAIRIKLMNQLAIKLEIQRHINRQTKALHLHLKLTEAFSAGSCSCVDYFTSLHNLIIPRI